MVSRSSFLDPDRQSQPDAYKMWFFAKWLVISCFYGAIVLSVVCGIVRWLDR